MAGSWRCGIDGTTGPVNGGKTVAHGVLERTELPVLLATLLPAFPLDPSGEPGVDRDGIGLGRIAAEECRDGVEDRGDEAAPDR